MPEKLGNRLFAQTEKWLLRSAQRRYHKVAVGILMYHPEYTDLQVGNAMMDFFEPERLEIGDPLSTKLSWETRPWNYRNEGRVECYLHEAHIPFSGTPELWQLYSSVRNKFKTRVRVARGSVRLRMMLPNRDVDLFRHIVAEDVVAARATAESQDSAIDAFRSALCRSIDDALKYHGIDYETREKAHELRQLADRQGGST